MGLLVVVSRGVPLDAHWIARDPFLDRSSHPRDFGVEADRAVLIDLGIDRLRWLAIAAVENGLSSQHSNAVVI